MSRPVRMLALVLAASLVTLACENTPAPAPTIPAPAKVSSPAASPTAVAQPPAPPTQRPLASGGGAGGNLGSPIAAAGGAVATVAIPKPAVTLAPRVPPAPFVPGAEPPSAGVANPIGAYLTPLPKPAGLAGGATGAGGTGAGGAGAGGAGGAGGTGGAGTGGAGAGGGIAVATTGPVTQLQPLPEVPLPPTPTVFRIDPGGGATTKR
jgi:hypothetical protein